VSSLPADTAPAARSIRSYVLRRSHFSNAQRDAYDRLMPVFGVTFSREPLDLNNLFGRTAPTILEIGFGMGDTTAEMARLNPGFNYLGVEVHTPGVGALLKLVQAQSLTNVRVIEHDVREVLEHQIGDGKLSGIHVFFPDPWPKARHHKRRLIQKQFVTLLLSKLSPGGFLHLATDWPDYATQMVEVVDSTPGLRRLVQARDLLPGSVSGTTPDKDGPAAAPAGMSPRPVTKFERRGVKLGHPIADIIAVRQQTVKAVATDGYTPVEDSDTGAK
jgi:tRNA (guanine-N7-)-methyltransferase